MTRDGRSNEVAVVIVAERRGETVGWRAAPPPCPPPIPGTVTNEEFDVRAGRVQRLVCRWLRQGVRVKSWRGDVCFFAINISWNLESGI